MKRHIRILAAALFLGGCASTEPLETQEPNTGDMADSDYSLTPYEEWQGNQAQIEDELLSEGSRSFENPYIKLDPYEAAPLTALALFETEDPTQISLTVAGKDSDADVAHTVEGYQTRHQIPVLGLYPDFENTVTLVAETESGKTRETQLTVQTDPLPDDFLEIEQVDAQPEAMAEGLTFFVPSKIYPFALDHNGDVRWYSNLHVSHIFKRKENGNLLIATKRPGDNISNLLMEMDMMGKARNVLYIENDAYDGGDFIHHDIIDLPNGNYLATMHDSTGEHVEDEITEFNPQTGEIAHRINMKGLFPEEFHTEYEGPLEDLGDWFHMNALQYLEEDKSLLISSRHQDAVLNIDYPEGAFNWILSSHDKWPEEYEEYLLEPVGEVKFPSAQHAMMELPDQDGDEDTMDLLLFDNNYAVTRGDKFVSEDYSRAVQYRIDEEERTVEEVWSYGEERGEEFYSLIVGDADWMPQTENVLMISGYVQGEEADDRESHIVEVTHDNEKEVVYEAHIKGFKENSSRQGYRVERMPLYPEGWAFELE